MRKPLLTALALTALLPYALGCGGGCGEDPNPRQGSSSGGGGGRPDGGHGPAVPMSHFDNGTPATSRAEKQAAAAAAEAGGVPAVSAQNYGQNVLKHGSVTFVSVYTKGCPDCDTVSPVLEKLLAEFKGKVDFYRLDGLGLGVEGLLPADFPPLPAPAFILYENGRPISRQRGLPFAPLAVTKEHPGPETQQDYQKRLGDWFRDGLNRKSLEGPGL